jgi:GTP-binding protein
MAQPGEPGESLRLRLELKLLADVGLVGLPNAGKSTLISHLSAARPKIADYPFTTLIPNLGVVDAGEGRSFVLADIPGLIAGASQGAGLGHRFLRHIQRCRVLVHLLDAGRIDPETPLADYRTVTDELEAFDKGLLAKVQVVAVNKMDLDVGQAAHEAVTRALEGRPVFAISGATGFGLKDLKYALWGLLQALPVPAGDEADADDEEDSDDV